MKKLIISVWAFIALPLFAQRDANIRIYPEQGNQQVLSIPLVVCLTLAIRNGSFKGLTRSLRIAKVNTKTPTTFFAPEECSVDYFSARKSE